MKAVLLLLLAACLSSHLCLGARGSGTNDPWLTNKNCSELLARLNIPSDLQVPSGHKLQAAYYGKGLQHYFFNGSAWLLFNATADLYDVQAKVGGGGRKVQGGGHKLVVGQHFFLGKPDAGGGQPSWESFVPAASLVTAKEVQEVSVDPNSIAWSLLRATANSGSTDVLGAVAYVQRLATKGGLPPSTTRGAQLGDNHATSYSTIYTFYTLAESH